MVSSTPTCKPVNIGDKGIDKGIQQYADNRQEETSKIARTQKRRKGIDAIAAEYGMTAAYQPLIRIG